MTNESILSLTQDVPGQVCIRLPDGTRISFAKDGVSFATAMPSSNAADLQKIAELSAALAASKLEVARLSQEVLLLQRERNELAGKLSSVTNNAALAPPTTKPALVREGEITKASEVTEAAVAKHVGNGFDVNARVRSDAVVNAKYGAAPLLFWAAFGGHAAIIEVLLKAGADRSLQSESGETALQICERKKRSEDCIRLLQAPVLEVPAAAPAPAVVPAPALGPRPIMRGMAPLPPTTMTGVSASHPISSSSTTLSYLNRPASTVSTTPSYLNRPITSTVSTTPSYLNRPTNTVSTPSYLNRLTTTTAAVASTPSYLNRGPTTISPTAAAPVAAVVSTSEPLADTNVAAAPPVAASVLQEPAVPVAASVLQEPAVLPPTTTEEVAAAAQVLPPPSPQQQPEAAPSEQQTTTATAEVPNRPLTFLEKRRLSLSQPPVITGGIDVSALRSGLRPASMRAPPPAPSKPEPEPATAAPVDGAAATAPPVRVNKLADRMKMFERPKN